LPITSGAIVDSHKCQIFTSKINRHNQNIFKRSEVYLSILVSEKHLINKRQKMRKEGYIVIYTIQYLIW